MSPRKKSTQRQWRRMDLHLHTPASVDYKQPNTTYLDLLEKAEERNLDIIAFADHNSVRGYARYLEEIENLELLERLKRLRDDERARLESYRRLREKILVLPGFEFTATLGFHILAIFSPMTPVRDLEHLLLSLRVPSDKLDQGSGEVGATTDALTAYRMINDAGGLVIAAHANSSHGVAMPGFDFGGQTRIAYTQDVNLHALEVTDLDSRSRRRTAAFFSGTKPEYPRRMHCIQGSDAHKLDYDPRYKNEMGVGSRATEILVDEVSFEAIKEVLMGSDFSRTRPARAHTEEPFDPLREAREQGNTLVQAFHDRIDDKRGIKREILEDVVALANTNGGSIYIGAAGNVRAVAVGVDRPEHATTDLRAAISRQITPPLEVQIELVKSQGKNVLQVIVPRGTEVPYALESAYIYVRSESETNLAVRDEIIQLVRDAIALGTVGGPSPAVIESAAETAPLVVAPKVKPPRTGVEIVSVDVRKSTKYFALRDLRNARVVTNVTRASARKLWQYAIEEHEKNPVNPQKVQWVGDIGIGKQQKHGGKMRYDFVQRAGDKIFVYYGVTEDGIHEQWRKLIGGEEGEAETSAEEPAPAIEPVSGMPESPAVPPAWEAPAAQIEEPREEIMPASFEPTEPEIEEPMPRAEFELPVEEGLLEPAMDHVEELEHPAAEMQAETHEAEMLSQPVRMETTDETPMPKPEEAQPKTTAQLWREELERAMREAREKKNQYGEHNSG